ncbi:MAG: hypothetical protein ACW99G_23800 [Candidatus Thorarchaeota archaeon]|jgi:hypothetical protein
MTQRGSRFGKTFGGLDLGQGTDYLHFAGVDALTSVSNGTIDITVTGMTTLVSFVGTVQQSAATPVSMIIKSLSGNVANLAFYNNFAQGGVTMAAGISGTTLHWWALGTQA